MVKVRWPDGVKCPICGSEKVRFLANQRRWQCSAKHDASVQRQGRNHLRGLAHRSRQVASRRLDADELQERDFELRIARDLGVTQKTAWFMLQRIRLAMQKGTFGELDGEIEADETFIGGLARNMHKNKKAKITGTGGAGKAIVMGLLDRETRKVRVVHVPETQARDAARQKCASTLKAGS